MNIYLKKFIDEKFKNPDRALDLGAGDFFDVACLRQLGWKCDGVDLKSGVNLEKPYKQKNRNYNLVYSNYVIHKLKNKKNFIKTIYNNLKKDGWFFIHTFDQSDSGCDSKISASSLENILKKEGFKNIKLKIFSYYDNEDGHKHWHRILEAVGQK